MCVCVCRTFNNLKLLNSSNINLHYCLSSKIQTHTDGSQWISGRFLDAINNYKVVKLYCKYDTAVCPVLVGGSLVRPVAMLKLLCSVSGHISRVSPSPAPKLRSAASTAVGATGSRPVR